MWGDTTRTLIAAKRGANPSGGEAQWGETTVCYKCSMPSGTRKEPTEITCERCGEIALWIGGRRKRFCSPTCSAGHRNGNKPRQPKAHGSLAQRHTQRSRQLKIDRGQCRDCQMQINQYNVVCIDWDHRDPATKEFTISAVMGRVNWQIIEQEINKCDAVCRNCHAIRTHYNKHHMNKQRPKLFTASRGAPTKNIRYKQHAP